MAEFVINNTEGVTSTLNAPAWATEATQVNIAKTLAGIGLTAEKSEALLKLMFKGYEGVTKATKEGDKEIADLLAKIDQKEAENLKEQKTIKQATVAQTKAVDDLEQLQKDAINELGKLNTNTNQQNKDLDKILNDMNNGGEGIMSFAGAMGKGGNLLGGVLGVATKAAGIFGTALLGVATYIGSQFTETFKFLNNGLKQGTGGIIGLTHPVENVALAANMAGMSLEEFGEFAQANSKVLRVLGAKGFTDLYSKTLIATGGLLDIGMTAEDAVESVMTELEYRRRFGMMINQDTLTLRSSLMSSAKELRIFANAVGMSEDELRSQSEVQEDHVQLMRLQVEKLGTSQEDLVRSSQTVSRVMKSFGMEDLINPLFEAVSKGSSGLSDDFIEISKVVPGLLELVEKNAADFKMTGKLNANLGIEVFQLLQNMTREQKQMVESLQQVGDSGAVTLNNIITNIGKLSEEMIEKVVNPDLEDVSLSLLETFNKLGFIVNQSTSTIGDMGKTAMLALLGFDKASGGTFDFNAGITVMTEKILQFSKDVFGSNSLITESVDLLTDYINTMFGGQEKGESTEAFQKRLEEARTAFVNTVGGFAQKLGLDLNDQIKKGTLFDSVKRFFLTFFEELTYAINKASGGVLFGESADRSMTRQFIEGRIGNDEYLNTVGVNSGGDREAMTELLFTDAVNKKAKELNISNNLSQQVASGDAIFGKDNKATNIVMSDLRSSIPGFNNLSEAEQTKIFNSRVEEVELFNKNVADYVANIYKIVQTDLGVDLKKDATMIELLGQAMTGTTGAMLSMAGYLVGNDGSFNDMLSHLMINEDINKDTLHKFTELVAKRESLQFGNDQTSFMEGDSFLEDKIHRLGQGEGKRLFTDIAGLQYNTNDDPSGKNMDLFFRKNEDFQKLQTLYNAAMEDKQMHRKEAGPMQELINKLEGSGEMDKDTTNLLTKMSELIESQRSLTNKISELNDYEPPGT